MNPCLGVATISGRGRERERERGKKKTASVERLKKRMDNRDSCLNLFTLQTLPLQEENTHSSRKEEGKGWRERQREREARRVAARFIKDEGEPAPIAPLRDTKPNFKFFQ